jgi:hypothetical protein
VPHSTAQRDKEPIATRMPEDQAGVRVVRGHHLLVRCSRWRSHLLREFSAKLILIAIEPALNGVHRRNGLLPNWCSATITTDRGLGVDKALDGGVPLL